MNSPKRPRRQRTAGNRSRVPSPQYGLDQEERIRSALVEERDVPEVIERWAEGDLFFEEVAARGGEGIRGERLPGEKGDLDKPFPPPTPPVPQDGLVAGMVAGEVIEDLLGWPAMDPYDAELVMAIEDRLKGYGITSVLQLVRAWSTAVLMEAIEDYQRAVESGMRIASPTGYFRSLLK